MNERNSGLPPAMVLEDCHYNLAKQAWEICVLTSIGSVIEIEIYRLYLISSHTTLASL